MAEKSYLAVDLETTGLNPARDRILEIGALRVKEGQVEAEFCCMVNPGILLGEKVMEITGITNEMAAEGMEPEAAVRAFLEFAGDFPLLGHRILFDYSFLKTAAGRLGCTWERRGIDTLEICRRFMPGEEKKNLGAACRFYGIPVMGSHRAIWDAWSAHELYQEVCRRYPPEDAVFAPRPLIYRVKKEQPASKRQKERLQELLKYHKIKAPVQVDCLTRSEASRLTDQITGKYGRR